MTDDPNMTDAGLEKLFEAARATPPEVPEALVARVHADAVAERGSPPLWMRLAELFGGLPGLGGLVTATCVGVWLGVAPPASLPDLAGQMLGFATYADDDLNTVGAIWFGWDIEEG